MAGPCRQGVAAGGIHPLGDPAQLGVLGDANRIIVTGSFLPSDRPEPVRFPTGCSRAVAPGCDSATLAKREMAKRLRDCNPAFLNASHPVYVKKPPSQVGIPLDIAPTAAAVQLQIRLTAEENPQRNRLAVTVARVADPTAMAAVEQAAAAGRIRPQGVPAQ